MTKKQVIKNFRAVCKQLDEEHLNVPPKNRTNVYWCNECQNFTKTQDVDWGVTPFFHTCHHCGNHRAKSSFYKHNYKDAKVHGEWYRATEEELLKFNKKKQFTFVDHIINGGLLYRKIK